MNHTYNSFLDKNLLQLLEIYQKEIQTHQKGCLVIKFGKNQKIDVFFQPEKNLALPVRQEIQAIKNRSSQLLQKDRHVLTCATQSQPYPTQVKEVFFIISDPSRYYLLRGYQQTLSNQKYTYEFETFLEKPDGAQQLDDGRLNIEDESKTQFKGKWMIQNTDAGQKFLRHCRKALEDDTAFQNFRSDFSYQNIIIGGDQTRAEKYLQTIPYPYLTIPELHECDQLGNPPKHGQVQLSTYTLRCIHTVFKLKEYFEEYFTSQDQSQLPRIVEIGSGHGGLCHVLSKYFQYRSYTLIDLPIVNQLAEKYLSNFPTLPHKKIRYMNTEQIMPRKYDLLISEFALSELDLKAQEYYLENVVKYCQKAYLAVNIWDPERKADFKKRLYQVYSQIKEYPEEPPSDYPNYLWVCRK